MQQTLNILVIEDNQSDFMLVERHLRQQGQQNTCVRVDNFGDMARALDTGHWDLILTDYSIPSMDFLESFAYIRSRVPDLPIILVSGSVGEEQAVELLKMGMWDFVLKDNLTRLVPAIERSLREMGDRKARLAAEESMRESEYRFRSIFNRSPVAISISRRDDGRLVEVNDAWLMLLGYERDEVINRTTTEINVYTRPDERSKIIGMISKCGQVVNREVQLLCKSGKLIDVLYSAELIELGGEFFLQVMMTDITDKKLNEKAREATVDLLRICNMADNLPELMKNLMHYFQKISGCEAIGVRLRDGDDFPYYVTRGFSEDFVLAERSLCAYDMKGELIRDSVGHPALDCMCGNILCGRFDPEKPFFTDHGSFWSSCTSELLARTTDADRQAKTRNRCNSEGYESVALLPLRYKDETYGLFQFNDKEKGVFTSENIALYEGLVDYVSITLSKLRGDEALRASEQALRKFYVAVEQSPAVIVITDAQGRIEFVNPRFTQVTGYAADEAIGQNPRVLRGDTNIEVYKELWATISEGMVWEGEFHNKRKDGTYFWEHATISPIRDASGAITHYMALKEDITEKRNLEHQLRQSQKMEAIGTLAGGIAHDFNNILTAMIGYSTLLQIELKTSGKPKEYADGLIALVERAANLTRGLLAFSRNQVMTPRMFNLNEVVTTMTKLISRLIGENIVVETRLSGHPLSVMADCGQIEQVLMNLATNARDAMPTGGRLKIITDMVTLESGNPLLTNSCQPGTYAMISVMDTGTGMDEATTARVFEPFFTTKEQGKGTGLGLSILYGIIKQHHGLVSVDSKPGSGTTFKVYLPFATTVDEPMQDKGATSVLGGTETILLADDDPMIRKVLKNVLEQFGYEVLEAVDGEEAVRVFSEKSSAISLAILDMIMPRKNGKEVSTAIKEIAPGVKTLFFSGYPTDVINQRGLLPEGAQFLQKPVSPMELLGKIRLVLDA